MEKAKRNKQPLNGGGRKRQNVLRRNKMCMGREGKLGH